MASLLSVILPLAPDIAKSAIANQWLQQCLDSLARQTWQDFEIILVGPAAGSGHWPEAAIRCTDTRVHRIRRQHPGIVAALNDGFAYAKGEFIARMDADDVAHPERLNSQLRYMKTNPDIGLSATIVEIDNGGETLGRGNIEYMRWLNAVRDPLQIRENLYVESPCPHPTWMMKREVWQQLDGYRDCSWAEDYDFLLRADLAGIQMGKPTTGPLLKWRDHNNRLTRCNPRYSKEQFIAAKAWALAQSHLRQRDAVVVGTGRNAKRMFDALNHWQVNVQAFVDVHQTVKKKTLRGKPVTNYAALANREHGDALLLSVITRFGARENLRIWFKENDFNEIEDYIIAG